MSQKVLSQVATCTEAACATRGHSWQLLSYALPLMTKPTMTLNRTGTSDAELSLSGAQGDQLGTDDRFSYQFLRSASKLASAQSSCAPAILNFRSKPRTNAYV